MRWGGRSDQRSEGREHTRLGGCENVSKPLRILWTAVDVDVDELQSKIRKCQHLDTYEFVTIFVLKIISRYSS